MLETELKIINDKLQSRAESVKRDIVSTLESIDSLYRLVNILREELDKCCQHPTETIEQSYYRGGYDYISSVTITHTCSTCGKVLKSYKDHTHQGRYA